MFYGISRSSSEVEDILSEVFLFLVKNNASVLRQFKGNSALSTWLRKVVVSKTINYMRSMKNLPKLLEYVPEDAFAPSLREAAPSPPEASIKKETVQFAKKLLGSLNDRERLVVKLFFFEHKKYREIAAILHIPINSIGPILTRAIITLRNHMMRSKDD
jgi:RNA polymerase sigma-70 factor (ECF subfamily)